MHTKIWRKKCIENRNEERNRKGKKQKQIDIRKRRNKVQSKRNKQKNVISSFRSFWAAMSSMNNKVFIKKNIFRVSCRLSILMVIFSYVFTLPSFLALCLPVCLYVSSVCLFLSFLSVFLSACIFFSLSIAVLWTYCPCVVLSNVMKKSTPALPPHSNLT